MYFKGMFMNREYVDGKADHLSNMSHELRNALNILMASCTMAQKHVDDRERVLDYLSRIYSTGDRMTRIIDGVLDFRSVENHMESADPTPFTIGELEKELKQLLEPLAAEKKVSLCISTESFFTENIIGDYDRLIQCLINIVTNSIKYTSHGGSIMLCFEEEKGGSNEEITGVFTCSDDGIGIPEDFLIHIFEPFARADDERIKEIKGTGLGMAIVKANVEAMGGSIHIDSRVNVGTTVTIKLRLKKNTGKG